MNDTNAMPSNLTAADFVFQDIGRMGYLDALEMQRDLHAEVLAGDRPPTVLLLEHRPVITFGRSPDAKANLVAGQELLEREGVEVCQTDRGGDITYHGPGQLVAYPILPLNDLRMNLRQYVNWLEDVIIRTVGRFGIDAHRDECAVGVWVTPEEQGDAEAIEVVDAPDGCAVPNRDAKIAAIGVRVKRWVTMHGLALNVEPNLDHFKLIVPCGLAGRPVTSMRKTLGAMCPTMDEVKIALTEIMRAGWA